MHIKGFRQRMHEGLEFSPSLKWKDSLEKKYGVAQILLFKAVIIVLSCLLLGGLAKLQVLEGSSFRDLAEHNRTRLQEVKPLRGLIYDRNGYALVENEPNFALMAVPVDLYQNEFPVQTIIDTLSRLYPTDEEFKKNLQNLNQYSYVPIVLKKRLTYREGMQLLSPIESWPGVYLQENFRRNYPYGELISHVLGYTSFITHQDLKDDSFYSITDIKGKEGIELMYEHLLRGKKGSKEIQIDAFGKENKTLHYNESTKGTDVQLTIDIAMQAKLTELLKKYMEEFDVSKSAGIILDPQNGEILSLVSLPSYDNNIFTNELDQEQYASLISNPNNPLFNRAIKGDYPPGSTFKLIIGSAALEEGVAAESFTVLSTGGISVGKWFFPDWKPGGHGRVNINGAIAWSVNTYFYIVGGGYEGKAGLGLEKIVQYAGKFNLGKQTGIDLPNESKGFLPSRTWKRKQTGENWYLGDTYHISIGQGDLLATPLQIALWTSFFANGGTLYRPHFMQAKNDDNFVIDKNFISRQNIEIMRNGLRGTVVYGSARSLNNLPVTVAGKTGSSQFATDKKPHGWFTAFAPFENPKLTITILMEEGDGSDAAVPVAREFILWYFSEYKKMNHSEL